MAIEHRRAFISSVNTRDGARIVVVVQIRAGEVDMAQHAAERQLQIALGEGGFGRGRRPTPCADISPIAELRHAAEVMGWKPGPELPLVAQRAQ